MTWRSVMKIIENLTDLIDFGAIRNATEAMQ